MNAAPHNSIWYASSMRPYPENEPWFYEPENIDWAKDIEKHWPEYKEEVTNFINEKDNKFRFTEGFYGNIDANKGWSAISFLFWGTIVSREFERKCPKLSARIKQIPGVVSLSLSRLEPGTLIEEHRGDTNAVMRSHFGVEVPGELPACGFKVNGEDRSWKEGKWLICNDAYKHSAWNNTGNRRTIIILDVVRPQFLKKKNLICAFILTRHASYLYDKVKLIRILPVFFKTILFGGILAAVYVLKPLYNLFK